MPPDALALLGLSAALGTARIALLRCSPWTCNPAARGPPPFLPAGFLFFLKPSPSPLPLALPCALWRREAPTSSGTNLEWGPTSSGDPAFVVCALKGWRRRLRLVRCHDAQPSVMLKVLVLTSPGSRGLTTVTQPSVHLLGQMKPQMVAAMAAGGAGGRGGSSQPLRVGTACTSGGRSRVSINAFVECTTLADCPPPHPSEHTSAPPASPPPSSSC